MNMYDQFCETAEKQPDHPAVIGPKAGNVRSYRQLREQVDDLADRLAETGIRPGQCVGIHYPSGPDYIVLIYATWRLRACAVPIAVELRPDEKEQICREIHVDHIVGHQRNIGGLVELGTAEPAQVTRSIVSIPLSSRTHVPESFSATDPAFLRFTSGTTGEAKGVVLSQRTVFERINAANEILRIGPGDRVVFLLSMSYHFTVSVVSYLTFGATIILCHSSFGDTIVKAVEEQQGTLIYGSPMHYDVMSAVRGENGLPSVRAAISTTTGLHRGTADAFYRRFGLPLCQAYGIIEVGLPCINLDKPREKFDSVGRLLPSYDITFRDSPTAPEGLKVISFRGPGLIDAYYEPWQTRKEIMPDGWFSTGDLGVLDEEGFLYIHGRAKDMISVAGMKFFAQEVEAILKSHPDVSEACVYPEYHERLGEVAVADVVAVGNSQTAEMDLKEYCITRLNEFKVPAHIRFVDNLKRTASGKVIRRNIMSNPTEEIPS